MFKKKKHTDNILLESSRWRAVYKKAFAYGILFSILLHLFMIMWVFVFSEKKNPNVKTVKIKTYYEKIPPPIKYEPQPPKLVKSFDMVKEQSTVTETAPKEYTLTEVTPDEFKSSEIRPNVMGGQGSRGGEGSVFHGALTSSETGIDAGWSIPGGTKSYGRSLGRGGSGGFGVGGGPDIDYGPDITSEVVNTRVGTRGTEGLQDQLIDYSNLTDRFEGLVKQGQNKKDIQGFLNFYQVQYRSSRADENGEPGWNVIPNALQMIVEFANRKTKLRINLKGSVRLDSKELMEIPLLFMMGSESEPVLSKEELKNLANYLRNGGFLWIDDGYAARWGAFNQKNRQYISQALGYDGEFEKIPQNHWIYKCYEEFAGPPPGEDELRPNANHPVKERYRYLEGVFINGRLAVLLSSKGYCKAWGVWPRNPPSLGGPLDNTRQLQFALNVIVYACTQKGGIVDRIKQRLAQENK